MHVRKTTRLLALLSIISLLMLKCKHELPVSCADIGFKLSVTKTDALLNNLNGTITATATGGSGFQYSLNGSAFKDTGYFAGLAAFASYKIVGRNATGCTDTVDIVLGSHNPCQGKIIVVSTITVDASPNLANGSVTATATGSTGFTYSINSGAFQAGNSFTNLAAGIYTIAARSETGCLGTAEATVGTKNPCAGVTVAVTTTAIQPVLNQSNGTITATATGGSGFTYSLNNGAFQTGASFSGLAAGTYTITAKNSNGCTGVIQASLVGADPCAGVTVVVTSTQVNPGVGLSNGSITAGATGGSGFTYSLNNGAYQTSATFSGLATGNYTLTAKNAAGCTGVAQVALGANNPCAGVTVVVTATQVNPTIGSSNGTITASASGGTGFTYSLNNGAYQASGTFGSLAAGTYTVTAKNASGCLGVKQVILTATDPCAGITVAVTTSFVNPGTGLSNGSIAATATGGTGFTYSINNGTFSASGTFSNLAAGTYTITAKNSSGCMGTKQVILTATSPCTNVAITLTAIVVNTVPCVAPANNGSITVTAAGSTGLTYNINGGAYQTSNVFASLNAATYLVGVKDVNGCTKSFSVIVGVVPQGTTFSPVRALISAKCSGGGCHMNGGAAAGYNFDADCSIVNYWSQINGACVTGTLKKMPLSPQVALTAAEKQTITNWINAGHKYNN